MLLTEREAAAFLRVSVRTMKRRRQAGVYPWVMEGRRVCYWRPDLEAAILATRQQAGPASTRGAAIPQPGEGVADFLHCTRKEPT